MSEYFIHIDRVIPVEAESDEEAIEKAHDHIREVGISSEDLVIDEVVDNE